MRTTRFGSAPDPRFAEYRMQGETREEILDPTLGVHAGHAPYTLPPGFSPDSRNFLFEGGAIRPRSGLSLYASSGATTPLLGGASAPDLDGNLHAIAAGETDVVFYDASTGAWSALSSDVSASPPSGTSRHAWQMASIYDASLDKNIGVLTNGKDLPKQITLQSGTTLYQEVEGFSDLALSAKAVCAFDNRLVWFNVSDASTSYPQRVLWSPRGLPGNYELASGAGFEDLLDMQGRGQAVVAESDGILLFSDREIWRGRKRLDAYVFDFRPVSRHFGCPFPASVARTPDGVAFLGRDLEVYLVSGEQVLPLGPAAPGDNSRIRDILRREVTDATRCFAYYNHSGRRYELYYPGTDSLNGFSTRALFYSFENHSWFPQTLGLEVSMGMELREPDDPGPTFDQLSTKVDDMEATFDSIQTPGLDYQSFLGDVSGDIYRFIPTEAKDAGVPFRAYWRSHGLSGKDRYRWDRVREVWISYDALQPGSLTLKGSATMGDDFLSEIEMPLPAAAHGQLLVPVDFSAPSPLFELNIQDGTRPRIARMSVFLADGGRYGG